MRADTKLLLVVLLFLVAHRVTGADASPEFDAVAAERFARLALACVHKEYPNKISHVLNSDADVAPPRKLTPAFYGCYDWHSSVHGHWLLARLARTFPDAPFAEPAREALRKSLTAENMKQEVAYLRGDGRGELRAALRLGLAAAARRGTARVGRSGGARDVRRICAAGGGGGGAA